MPRPSLLKLAAAKLQGLIGARGQKGQRSRNRAQFNLRGRLALVAGTLGVCSLVLLARAVDLQVVDNDFYQRQGDARFLREIPIATSRGMITDRNGEPLAVSTPVESIWANPQLLLKSPERIPQLAKALGVPSDHLARKLSQRASKEFVYLQRRMRPEAAQEIVKLGIPGVFSQREYRRFYPQGDAVAQTILRQSGEFIGAGLANVIIILAPNCVVIGGGIAQAGPALFEPLSKYLDRFEWRPMGDGVQIRAAALGERAGAIGAAYYAILAADERG